MNPTTARLAATAEDLGATITVLGDEQFEARNAKGKRLRVGLSGSTIIVYRPDGPGPRVETKAILTAEAEITRALTDNRTVKQAGLAYRRADARATRALKDVRYRTVNGLPCSDARIERAEATITAATTTMNLAAARLIELGAW